MRKRIDYCKNCENGWVLKDETYCLLNGKAKSPLDSCPSFSERNQPAQIRPSKARPSPTRSTGFEWPGDRTALIAATASVTLAILVLLPI